MAGNINKWSKTAATNSNADATINWAEGQAPSTVNDSARALMAAIADDRDDTRGALTLGGTLSAMTLTTNSVSTAYINGLRVAGKIAAVNGASFTLNVDGIGARKVFVDTATGYVQPPAAVTFIGQHVSFEYDSTLDTGTGGFVMQTQPAGRIIAIQVLTSGTTYTRTPGASTGDVFLVGGPGGGGGPPATGASQFSAGGGGGSGAVTAALNVALPATATIAIGAKGTVTAGNAGGAGGATTFTGGTLTLTAPGGAGGGSLGPTVATSAGGAPGGGGAAGTFTGGTFSNPGNEGNPALICTNGVNALRGVGGMTPLWGYGQGGNGNSIGSSTSAAAGFQGSSAAIIIFERS